ncbi:MAG: hypothetical protein V4484_18680 [Pseudomonadota bacterium]
MAAPRNWQPGWCNASGSTPGHVAHKGFTATDGERVTIVEFDSEQGMRLWAAHPEHVAAKKMGRASFFSEYSVQICQLQRTSRFPRGEALC